MKNGTSLGGHMDTMNNIATTPNNAIVTPQWPEDLTSLKGQRVIFCDRDGTVRTLGFESVQGRMNGGTAIFRKPDGCGVGIVVWRILWIAPAAQTDGVA